MTEPIAEPIAEPSVGPTSEPIPAAAESVRPALERLAALGALPTPEHVEVYEDVHRRLHGALSDLDAARG